MLSSCSTAKPDLLLPNPQYRHSTMEIKLKTAALQYTRTWPKKHPAFDACSLPCSTQQAGDFGFNPTAGYVRLGCLLSTIQSHNCCWGVCLVVSSSGFSAAAVGNVVIKKWRMGGRREVSVVSSLVYVCVKTTTIEY